MCKVIAIANQKGGVGKTTTTVNLGIGLARKGKRVVLIDADPQGSMTVSLGIDEPDKIEYSLANVLMDVVNEEEIDYAKIILKHEENIDFIPANIELAGLEVSMVNVMSRELVMKRFISNIKENYDYILIDCMPSLGMITISSSGIVFTGKRITAVNKDDKQSKKTDKSGAKNRRYGYDNGWYAF